MEWDVAIIGGGASGLAAAVEAAEAGARVVLLEADERVGRSILVSGNGRCNFSNAHIQAHQYHNAKFAAEVLATLERDQTSAGTWPNGVVRFFQQHGLLWREEAEGRLYPQANKASVVLEVLRSSAAAADVQIRCEASVKSVEAPRGQSDLFMLRLSDGELLHARSVIVACGGRITREMLPDGFVYKQPRPLLGSIATGTELVRRLDKIRVRGAISLVRDGRVIASETGEIMFRKYGVSGIAAFNLSRLMKPGDELCIDMLGAASSTIDAAEEVSAGMNNWTLTAFEARADQVRTIYGSSLTCEDVLRGLVLPTVGDVLCAYAGLGPEDAADVAAIQMLWNALTAFTLKVHGIGDESICQVRRGGFAVDSFDRKTLQAHDVPGLYVTGEALDVDGPCGGYNLHWAFATGILAGRSAAAGVEVRD